MKLYPRVPKAKYYIHAIDPMSVISTARGVGHSNDSGYAIRRCKELAESHKGKSHLMFYRVVERGNDDPIFVSKVDFDEVAHYDMREKKDSPEGENED